MAASSVIKLECPICFNEANSFKILQCGHHFCSPCVDQLRSDAKSTSPSTDICCSVTTTSIASGVKTKDLECPQCRQMTPANVGLKTKFMSNLMCRQCDEEKLVDEFRWCHQCSVSVCSKCFVDKHVTTNEDGSVVVHRASKWDFDYPAAKYCIGQLRREADGVDDHVKKVQDYLSSYLEGFQEYLFREIDQRVRTTQGHHYESKIAELAQNYDVNIGDIKASDKIDKNYELLLRDLLKVANVDTASVSPSPQALSENQLKLTCLPYKTMTDIMLGVQPHPVRNDSLRAVVADPPLPVSDTTSEMDTMITALPGEDNEPPPYATMDVDTVSSVTDNNNQALYPPLPRPVINNNGNVQTDNAAFGFVLNDNFYDVAKGGHNLLDVDTINRKFASTIVVRPDVIKQPSDICYLPSINTLLITDHIGGIYTLKNNRTLNGPVASIQRYNRYSRITVIPSRLIQSAAMVHVQIGPVWYYTVVAVNGEGRAEQVQLHNKSACHCAFPISRQPTTASSDRSLYCLTPKSLYRFAWPEQQSASGDWHEIYDASTGANSSPKHAHLPQGRLGPIIDRNDRTEVYMINPIWQSIDIVTFRYPDHSLINVNRVKLISFFPKTIGTVNPFVDPYLAKLTDATTFLLADKKRSNTYVWNKDENSLMQWHDFSTKTPQKIVYVDNAFFVITQNQNVPNIRALELVTL